MRTNNTLYCFEERVVRSCPLLRSCPAKGKYIRSKNMLLKVPFYIYKMVYLVGNFYFGCGKVLGMGVVGTCDTTV